MPRLWPQEAATNEFIYYITGGFLFMYFVILFVTYLSRKDETHVIQIPPNEDFQNETHLFKYLVMIRSSLHLGCSCSPLARVHIQLVGSKHTCAYFRVQTFLSGRFLFQRGCRDIVLVRTKDVLGEIEAVKIVVSGDKNHKWKVEQVEVMRVGTGERWTVPHSVLDADVGTVETWDNQMTSPLVISHNQEYEKYTIKKRVWWYLMVNHQWTSSIMTPIRYGAYTSCVHVLLVFWTISSLCLVTILTYIITINAGILNLGYHVSYACIAAFVSSFVLGIMKLILHQIRSGSQWRVTKFRQSLKENEYEDPNRRKTMLLKLPNYENTCRAFSSSVESETKLHSSTMFRSCLDFDRSEINDKKPSPNVQKSQFPVYDFQSCVSFKDNVDRDAFHSITDFETATNKSDQAEVEPHSLSTNADEGDHKDIIDDSDDKSSCYSEQCCFCVNVVEQDGDKSWGKCNSKKHSEIEKLIKSSFTAASYPLSVTDTAILKSSVNLLTDSFIVNKSEENDADMVEELDDDGKCSEGSAPSLNQTPGFSSNNLQCFTPGQKQDHCPEAGKDQITFKSLLSVTDVEHYKHQNTNFDENYLNINGKHFGNISDAVDIEKKSSVNLLLDSFVHDNDKKLRDQDPQQSCSRNNERYTRYKDFQDSSLQSICEDSVYTQDSHWRCELPASVDEQHNFYSCEDLGEADIQSLMDLNDDTPKTFLQINEKSLRSDYYETKHLLNQPENPALGKPLYMNEHTLELDLAGLHDSLECQPLQPNESRSVISVETFFSLEIFSDKDDHEKNTMENQYFWQFIKTAEHKIQKEQFSNLLEFSKRKVLHVRSIYKAAVEMILKGLYTEVVDCLQNCVENLFNEVQILLKNLYIPKAKDSLQKGDSTFNTKMTDRHSMLNSNDQILELMIQMIGDVSKHLRSISEADLLILSHQLSQRIQNCSRTVEDVRNDELSLSDGISENILQTLLVYFTFHVIQSTCTAVYDTEVLLDRNDMIKAAECLPLSSIIQTVIDGDINRDVFVYQLCTHIIHEAETEVMSDVQDPKLTHLHCCVKHSILIWLRKIRNNNGLSLDIKRKIRQVRRHLEKKWTRQGFLDDTDPVRRMAEVLLVEYIDNAVQLGQHTWLLSYKLVEAELEETILLEINRILKHEAKTDCINSVVDVNFIEVKTYLAVERLEHSLEVLTRKAVYEELLRQRTVELVHIVMESACYETLIETKASSMSSYDIESVSFQEMQDLHTGLHWIKNILIYATRAEKERNTNLDNRYKKKKRAQTQYTMQVYQSFVDSVHILDENCVDKSLTEDILYELEWEITRENKKPLPHGLKLLLVIFMFCSTLLSTGYVGMAGGQLTVDQVTEWFVCLIVALLVYGMVMESIIALCIGKIQEQS